MEWWNDVRMLCARYLVASETMERSGPVEAAVRSAGYVSEDEEELTEGEEEEEEGSSVEEEEGAYEDGDEYHNVVGVRGVDQAHDGVAMPGGHIDVPPSYTHPEKGGIEIGPNGYAVRIYSSLSSELLVHVNVIIHFHRSRRRTVITHITTPTMRPNSSPRRTRTSPFPRTKWTALRPTSTFPAGPPPPDVPWTKLPSTRAVIRGKEGTRYRRTSSGRETCPRRSEGIMVDQGRRRWRVDSRRNCDYMVGHIMVHAMRGA